MSNVLSYRGYLGIVEYDSEENILFGKIEGIADLVTFESNSVDQIVKEFHSAVDDYIAYCIEIGKTPDKPYKGSYNVRMSPDLHRKAAMFAIRNGKTLNSLTVDAVTSYLTEGKNSVIFNFYAGNASDAISNYNSQTTDFLNSWCEE